MIILKILLIQKGIVDETEMYISFHLLVYLTAQTQKSLAQLRGHLFEQK